MPYVPDSFLCFLGGAAGSIAPLVASVASGKAEGKPGVASDIPPATTVATDDPNSPTRVSPEMQLAGWKACSMWCVLA